MQPRSIFLEIGRPSPSPLYEAWAASRVVSGTEPLRISSFEDLDDVTPRAGDFLVLPWSASDVPEYAVERVCQEEKWIVLPLVVVLETMASEVREFLREYQLPYLVNGRETGKAAIEVARCVAQDRIQAEPAETRRFFHHLARREFADAERLTALWKARPESERLYARGVLLKASKRFDEAHKVLGHGLTRTQKDLRLDPRFLHLIGAVAFKRMDHGPARDFLEASHKVSPLHLRRRLMLGELYVECGDLDQALAHFRAVIERVPDYPGAHARAIEVVYALARKPNDLAPVAAWLPFVPVSKFPALAKRVDLNTLKELRTLFASAIFRAYLDRAQRAVEADDHYGSLSLLTKAEVVARWGEASDLKDLFVARAETSLALGDPVLAEEAVVALIQGFARAPEALPLQGRLDRLKARLKKTG